MFENIKKAYRLARTFHVNMRIMGAHKKDSHTYRLGITEEQIGILNTCASYGIRNADDLIEKMTHVNQFNQRRKNGSTKENK